FSVLSTTTACSDHYGPILWETFNVEAEGIAGCPRRAVLIPVMFGLDIPASFYCFLILPIFTNPSCNCYFSHIFVALLKCNILDIFFTFLIFLFTDDKEDTVLGSLPLLSFQIGGVELSENITCKFAFKVEHVGTRTYYFSTDSYAEQEEWIRALSDAAEVTSQPRNRFTHTHAWSYKEIENVTSFWGKTAKASGTSARRLSRENSYTAIKRNTKNGKKLFAMPLNSSSKPPPSNSHNGHQRAEGHEEPGVGLSYEPREQQENVVLRRGFVPRTAPERLAQRKCSMAQLQQWVNQRRGMASQEDINRPPSYYSVNQEVSAGYYNFVDEYSLYLPGVRPDSICSMSAVGGYDRLWTIEQKQHSLRDEPHRLYRKQMPQDQWGPQYYGGMETSMRSLFIQPRSKSVPRSPSSSSRRPYSPASCTYASPARSLSNGFDRFSGRMNEDAIYPPVYSLRRSFSSPKVNRFTVFKLLGRLCEQNQILKDHEAVVHRLRMNKDSLEEALLATHQEMEIYHNQPLIMEKLQFKKETQQNQLINIRGELSQASSALTTACMEFEALEDEANAIHGDLWEQLNAGGQSELVRRHIQKEFWRVQDVLEGLQKNSLSRGIKTAKGRGSFTTNSPASPLSSVSLTSPLSPYSPVPVCQASPTKELGLENTNMFFLACTYKCIYFFTCTVGIVPPRTKSPTDESQRNFTEVHRCNSRVLNGVSRERPKSAAFPTEIKMKMSVEEQNERLRRNQCSSMRDKRRSLNLSGGQSPANYKVVRRRLTAHEIDIKDLEKAVRGQGQESPEEEIARLRLESFLNFIKEIFSFFPEEQKEKQKKLERIKTLIAKSNLQNMVPLLDGPVEGGAPASSQQQLQEQEKRIEISCALAAEASRRSRLLSGEHSHHMAASHGT
uniref:Pleckstrin homology domain containing A6 n=1 Tax=Pundamilia nyererei TaxID=303518 RepID=A0A3B4F182_9CICH